MEKGGLLTISRLLARQRFQVLCRDTRCSVATGVGLRQDISVAIGHGMSRQCRVHDSDYVRRLRSWRARHKPACATRRPWAHTQLRATRHMSFVMIENSLSRQTS